MKTIDYSGMIVMYNLTIGVLLFLSSEKLGQFAGVLNTAYGPRLNRITLVSFRALGGTWAMLSGAIYLGVHVLKLGV
jgi:hypothetical protein